MIQELIMTIENLLATAELNQDDMENSTIESINEARETLKKAEVLL